jgi:hypothetical protein
LERHELDGAVEKIAWTMGLPVPLVQRKFIAKEGVTPKRYLTKPLK